MSSSSRVVGACTSVLLLGIAIVSAAQTSQGANALRLRYRCPDAYKRIGNYCYYLSNEKLTWHDAQFACQDLSGGYLAKLDRRWKDRSLKSYLNRSEGMRLERWFGTIYDFGRHTWIWGVGGEKLRYQGFSRRKPNDNYTWRCGILDPVLYFRWGTRSCIEKKGYVCEAPIKIFMSDRRKKKNLRPKKRKQKNFKQETTRQLFPNVETNQIT